MDKFEENEVLIYVKEALENVPEIPKGIKGLDIRRNRLKCLDIDKESNLEYLDASDNLIKTFTSIDNLKSLEFLDLGYNLIKEIPKINLPSLKELYLMSNDISKIENVNFSGLKILDLANNDIKELENLECSTIEECFLGVNNISKICDMSGLENLKILDLQWNKLSELDCNLLPSGLENLLLQGNKELRSLKNLDRLSHLKILGIKGTKLSKPKTNASVEIW